MVTITDALVSEHAAFSAVFDQIERVLPNIRTLAEVRILAHLVEGLLLKHAATEEDLVLFALDRIPVQQGRCNRFFEEHQEIDARLRQAQTANRLVQARSLLQAAVLGSRRHFGYEERFVFPVLEQVITHEELSKLGRLWLHRRRRLSPNLPSVAVPAGLSREDT